MMTSCSHTFCSVCIRRCLDADGRCPGCRAQDQATKLRNNWALEAVVESFKRAKPEVIEFGKKVMERPQESLYEGAAIREKLGILDKREDEEDLPSRKRTRSGRPTRAATRGRTARDAEVIEVVDSDADDDFIPEDAPLQPGFVECPVCCKPVKEQAINSHLDRNCQETPKKSKVSTITSVSSPRKGFGETKLVTRQERLPQVHYSMIKDGPLRKKLSDQGLSAAGARQTLERRYSEWVTLWNANCDATNPKSKSELRRELDIWERNQREVPIYRNPGAQIKDKDFDREAYAQQQGDSFKDLIAKARAKLPAKKTVAEVADSLLKAIDESDDSAPMYQSPYGYRGKSDTDMAGTEEGGVLLGYSAGESTATLPSRPSSQRRALNMADNDYNIYEDAGFENSGLPTPSQQYPNEMPVFEKNAAITSDCSSTMANLQS